MNCHLVSDELDLMLVEDEIFRYLRHFLCFLYSDARFPTVNSFFHLETLESLYTPSFYLPQPPYGPSHQVQTIPGGLPVVPSSFSSPYQNPRSFGSAPYPPTPYYGMQSYPPHSQYYHQPYLSQQPHVQRPSGDAKGQNFSYRGAEHHKESSKFTAPPRASTQLLQFDSSQRKKSAAAPLKENLSKRIPSSGKVCVSQETVGKDQNRKSAPDIREVEMSFSSPDTTNVSDKPSLSFLGSTISANSFSRPAINDTVSISNDIADKLNSNIISDLAHVSSCANEVSQVKKKIRSLSKKKDYSSPSISTSQNSPKFFPNPYSLDRTPFSIFNLSTDPMIPTSDPDILSTHEVVENLPSQKDEIVTDSVIHDEVMHDTSGKTCEESDMTIVHVNENESLNSTAYIYPKQENITENEASPFIQVEQQKEIEVGDEVVEDVGAVKTDDTNEKDEKSREEVDQGRKKNQKHRHSLFTWALEGTKKRFRHVR
jgi:hypothetical protein